MIFGKKFNYTSLIVLILVISWLGFFTGWFLQIKVVKIYEWAILISSLVFGLGLLTCWFFKKNYFLSFLNSKFNDFDTYFEKISNKKAWIFIVLASALGLYFELMVIRLHTSYFQIFSYFKNISLIACFLGLGLGYALGRKKKSYIYLSLPLLTFQIILMHFMRLIGGLEISDFLQNPVSEELKMGLIHTTKLNEYVTVYSFIIFNFILTALIFVPLGQIASKLMIKEKNLKSYSWNLIGSILGILIFTILSFLWTPPTVWIIVGGLGIMLFVVHHKLATLITFTTTLLLATAIMFPYRSDKNFLFSPYQVLSINYVRNEPAIVKVNNVYYQRMLNLSDKSSQEFNLLDQSRVYYNLPYQFYKNPNEVLIVGSGTGNDVAAAVRNHAGNIDAVEIDPVIINIGKSLHPENPYGNENVHIFIDDARSYIKNTNKRYDLIVYGLLDSHTLLSNISSSIRLDSYVYTVEAFREARKKLKPEGAISLSFAVLGNENSQKLFLMLKEAFDGQAPLVYENGYDGSFTYLAGKLPEKTLGPNYSSVKNVTQSLNKSNLKVDPSTDDWPFFYMPKRIYPFSYFFMLSILMLISYLLLKGSVSGQNAKISWKFFFLGAGFMLVETKAITELALTFGSTWIINSIVITSLLIMAFIGNYFVLKISKINKSIVYALLIISLVIGLYLINSTQMNLLPLGIERFLSIVILTVPLLFSGIIFSTELKKTPITHAFYSNLLGAILGGFLEYNTMYFGFHFLYIFGIAIYLLAFYFSRSKLSFSLRG